MPWMATSRTTPATIAATTAATAPSQRRRLDPAVAPTRSAASERFAAPATATQGPIAEQAAAPLAPPKAHRLLTRVQQQLLDRYAPAAVVINRRYGILLFVGPSDRYVTQPAGVPTDDLLADGRDLLRGYERAALTLNFVRALVDAAPRAAAPADVDPFAGAPAG